MTSQFRLLQTTEEEGEEETRTIPQVRTYGCLGQPGFVYLVGCVHEGMPQTKRSSTSVQPPFKDCVAISSLCGASCSSGAYEPTIYDPSRPDMWQKQKDGEEDQTGAAAAEDEMEKRQKLSCFPTAVGVYSNAISNRFPGRTNPCVVAQRKKVAPLATLLAPPLATPSCSHWKSNDAAVVLITAKRLVFRTRVPREVISITCTPAGSVLPPLGPGRSSGRRAR